MNMIIAAFALLLLAVALVPFRSTTDRAVLVWGLLPTSMVTTKRPRGHIRSATDLRTGQTVRARLCYETRDTRTGRVQDLRPLHR